MHKLNVNRFIHLRLFARVRNAQKLVHYCYSPETAIGFGKVYIISQSGQYLDNTQLSVHLSTAT